MIVPALRNSDYPGLRWHLYFMHGDVYSEETHETALHVRHTRLHDSGIGVKSALEFDHDHLRPTMLNMEALNAKVTEVQKNLREAEDRAKQLSDTARRMDRGMLR